jgi:hypothetical protein
MPNTTNYSFPTPADTDLVKNGADAIRDLGDAVDTAMNTALGTKKSGLVLLNTTSFSAVASQSFSDVFSATYNSYKIVVSTIYGTTATDLRVRLRVSGSDNSSSIYNFQRLEYSNITLTGGRTLNQTSWAGGEFTNSATVISSGELFLSNPFNAVHTTGQSSWVSLANGVDLQRIDRFDWVHKSNDSFTGFTIFGGAGNITGTLSVYGFNK